MIRSHRHIYESQAIQIVLADESGLKPKDFHEYVSKQVGGKEMIGYTSQHGTANHFGTASLQGIGSTSQHGTTNHFGTASLHGTANQHGIASLHLNLNEYVGGSQHGNANQHVNANQVNTLGMFNFF